MFDDEAEVGDRGRDDLDGEFGGSPDHELSAEILTMLVG